jgi:prolyl oligopeptidase
MVMYRDLTKPFGLPTPLIDNFEASYGFIGNDGPVFYFTTNNDAPRERIIAIDIREPEPDNWTEIVPEADAVLQSVSFVGNLFVTRYLEDASTKVKLYRPDGRHVRDVELPGIGSAGGFGGKRSDTETFYTFSSFDTPPTIYRYDMITGESEVFRRAGVDFDGDDYVVKQVFYSSKDGTRVPMFITHRRGIELDGSHPTLLYGYGGFNISLTPGFSTSRAAWLEMGGIYAVANLRGGGEYGKAWHDAGRQMNKQNVFDDFIAAAEYLVDAGYTRPDKLAIQGGSNGGLLVAASMLQRPDLFGAALPAVGVLDMLRYHKFTIGRAWAHDYGTSEDSEEMFDYLLGYSPLHNVEEGVRYPATMITTADYDDRVVPAHSFKFAAELQRKHAGGTPVLIRIETGAGHGAGKPISKQIEELADMWSFLAQNLAMDLPAIYRD